MVQAVIFDMDGVLIDSEPFWQQAQVALMAELGVTITAKDCLQTMGLRIDQLVGYWARHYPWQGPSEPEVVERLIDRVIERVQQAGEAKPGVHATLAQIHEQGLPIGLATSSPARLMNAVLERLGIGHYFQVRHSADEEAYGKPHPGVYITAAHKLGVEPVDCLAIEDSFNGLLAAKAARMKTTVVPDQELVGDPRLAIADLQLSSLEQFQLAKFRAQA